MVRAKWPLAASIRAVGRTLPGRLLGHGRERLAQQQHGRRLVAHVAVVAHGEALGASAKPSIGPFGPQGGREAGGDGVGEGPLPADRLSGADAEPEGLARAVVEGAEAHAAADLVARRPDGHRGGDHARHRPGGVQRVGGGEAHAAAGDQALGLLDGRRTSPRARPRRRRRCAAGGTSAPTPPAGRRGGPCGPRAPGSARPRRRRPRSSGGPPAGARARGRWRRPPGRRRRSPRGRRRPQGRPRRAGATRAP